VNRHGVALLLVSLLLVVAACTADAAAGTGASVGPGSTATPYASLAPIQASASRSTATPPATGLPAFGHIYLIVLENKEYGRIVGNPGAPYLNRLIARYGSLTRMHGETHPSEPNYFALFSGSMQGATGDGTYNLSGKNLVDQLAAHGKSWRVFAQNVPLGCYTGYSASGGPDGRGVYARKHNPAISFTDVSGNPSRCARITNFRHFNPAAADFELIIPNMCNDMHDCSVATGDAFLAGFVPRIIDAPAFVNSVLFITFDEGDSSVNGGGRIATVVVSPLVRPGSLDASVRNHYSLLRTIEDAWGLGCLNATCKVKNLAALF
jgi:hypothetical protein